MVVVNVTVRPDDAVAPTVTGAASTVRSASAPKVIVWSALVTVKLCEHRRRGVVDRVAGLVGRTVHVPRATSVIVAPFVPPAVHTAGVVVVNVTARPDDAVAPTVTGDCGMVRSASAPNVIV